MYLLSVSGVLEKRKVGRLTRVSFPVKVILWIAVTLQFQPLLVAGWAMGKWNVIVGDVLEEVDFIFVQEKTGSNRMYWSVAPTLVEESTILVKRFEIVGVGFRSQPIEVTNFKVGPLEYD
jgi:hypothetical protein